MQMIEFIHEFLLHVVVVVVAGVMFRMGVFVGLRVGVLMMPGLCVLLWFRFGRLCGPPAPDPSVGQPHVSC